MRKTRRTYKYLLMPAMAAMLLQSCVMEDGPDASEKNSKEVVLNLNFGARSLSTRATDYDDVETDEAFIDLSTNDYSFYVVYDGRVMQRIETQLVSGEDKKSYTLQGTFVRESDEVQVIAMANWTKFGGSYTSGVKLGLTTLRELFADASNNVFTLPSGETPSWAPKVGKSGIPMFGISESVSVKGIAPNSNNPISVQIPMLRALTKIQIVNQTPGLTITSCRLTKYEKHGRFIPDTRAADGDDATTQAWIDFATSLKTSSLPAVRQEQGENLQFVDDAADETPATTFTAYIPEMDLSNLSGDERPQIEIHIKGWNAPLYVELANYADGKVNKNGYYEHLLRNHVYEFDITGAGAQSQLVIKTAQWDTYEDQEYVYKDAKAAFSSGFDWTNENYADPESNTILQVTTEDGPIGTFELSEPANGTWTLALYTDDATPNNAFRFETRQSGSEAWEPGSDTMTGNVGAGPVEFRIVATSVNESGAPYNADLVMTVMTFDGRIGKVDLSPNVTKITQHQNF